MHNRRLLLTLLLSLSTLALCACGVKPTPPAYAPARLICPALQPVPAPLMLPPPKPLLTAQRIQSLLFEPVTTPTGASANSASK